MKLGMNRIGGPLDLSSAERATNRAHQQTLSDDLDDKRAVVAEGWGAERVHRKNKWTSLERITALKDPDSHLLTVGTLVNWGREFLGSKRKAPGAGVITAFCQIHGRWTMVIANDNTVASGAWWPLTPEKIQRGQEMALKLGLPVIYLVDCSGLFLPEQSHSFPGRKGAGHIFKKNSELAAAGVPQIAGVFGDCIAGGGYMPIISDRVYMTESAYMVIAGAALIKGAKALELTSLDIGGPEVHVHRSGCADVRVPDDETAVQKIRDEVALLPTSGAAFYRHGWQAEEPMDSPAELLELLPVDHRHIYDVRALISRLVDGSLFHEVFADQGQEMVTGLARIGGLWMGVIANNPAPHPHPDGRGMRPGGILYREGIAKISVFSRACNGDGIPIVWLQDVAGFDIGAEAEAQGLLGYGSNLIYTNSTNETPMFTVLVRKASGAGYYAMAGHPYEPVVQLSLPTARLSVMEGRTLAIAAYNTKLDDNFEIATDDPDERKKIADGMAATEARIEADMDPVVSAANMDTDEIIRMDELRRWLVAFAEMSYQATGRRRIKNPRIWSVHDLEILGRGGVGPKETVVQPTVKAAESATAPEPGAVAVRAAMDGSFWGRPRPDAAPFLASGQAVSMGDTVGLVEVMKTFSPIRSESEGTWIGTALDDGAAIQPGSIVGWVRPG
jgi:acetyl-CoA carboxylase carboxyltransferase component/biotin carboxyl carrier protein